MPIASQRYASDISLRSNKHAPGAHGGGHPGSRGLHLIGPPKLVQQVLREGSAICVPLTWRPPSVTLARVHITLGITEWLRERDLPPGRFEMETPDDQRCRDAMAGRPVWWQVKRSRHLPEPSHCEECGEWRWECLTCWAEYCPRCVGDCTRCETCPNCAVGGYQ